MVLGRSVLPMQQLLRMGRGAVIPLDAKATGLLLGSYDSLVPMLERRRSA